MNVKIRYVTFDDIPEIAVIEKEAFSDPWSENSLTSYVGESLSIFLAAEDENGKLVGYIIGESDGRASSVEKIAVAQSARRQGVGTALLNEFISELIRNVESVTLEVRESNTAAQKLYEAFGFKTAGIRKNLYSSPQENGIVMILDLTERKPAVPSAASD